jgi:hypothetical protein
VNELIQHVVTRRVLEWAGTDDDRHAWIVDCLARHHRHDWGDVDHHDWAVNDRALACRAGRLLSAYDAPDRVDPPDGQLWIITEDLDDAETITTILWPSDY